MTDAESKPAADIQEPKPEQKGLAVARFANQHEALGFAVTLLCKVPPFDSFNFGTFVRALSGQIHRGHYLFTVKDGDLAGYAGWAMCTEEVARAWVEGRRNPSFEECASGDCWVDMTFYAATREANFYQARRCRRLYPNCKMFWNRQYADGRPKRRATTYNLIGEPGEAAGSG